MKTTLKYDNTIRYIQYSAWSTQQILPRTHRQHNIKRSSIHNTEN